MTNIDQTAIIDVLKTHSQICIAILFGSRAHGRATPASDLDLAVAAAQPLTAQEKLSLTDDLAVRFGCPIDIIDLQTVSGPILQQALCDGQIIIKQNVNLYAQLVLKMWYNHADFMPYYNRILKHRVESFAHG